MKRSYLTLLHGLALFHLALPASAQETAGDAHFCSVSLGIPPRPVVTEPLEPGDTHILADKVDYREGESVLLEGTAEVTQDQKQTRADVINYYQSSDTADLFGNVEYWDDDTYLIGPEAHVNFAADTAEFSQADYRLIENRGRGYADELSMEIGTTTRGTGVDYTTCDPYQEGDGWSLDKNFWKINASELTLDHENSRGSAKHVVLRIKDVPVFYTPYISFPLDETRKSGFLVPTLGTSSSGGLDFQTPYYWNIAPNMDATLTPRVVTDRGYMGMAEYRYLFERTEGSVNLEYLPSDSLEDGDSRGAIFLEHEQQFDSGRFSVLYNRVSDTDYLRDFGNSLEATSARYLPQQADVRYNGSGWNIIGRVQNYQTINQNINITNRPYKRLPQILFRARPLNGNNQINLDLETDFSYFERGGDDSLPNDASGFRYDINPTVSYPMRTEATFLTPTVGLRYTAYHLSDTDLFEDNPDRLLPSFSLDSGVFLERDLNLFGDAYLQTLEPRAHYLYVPDEDQSDLPVFDTGVYNSSFNNLFRANRFSGPDRFGDANQITLATTSRLIHAESGREQAYVRVGQSYYLDDQDVVRELINGRGELNQIDAVNTDFDSVLILGAGTRLIDNWDLDAELHWNPNTRNTEKSAVSINYHPGDGRALNLGYRVRQRGTRLFNRNPIAVEQTDVSFSWPITEQLNVVGRWNYAVSEARSLDLFAGIEYQGCCWGVRAVARRFLANLNQDFQTGFFLQFQLKGLAGMGQETVNFLNQSIPGYENRF